MDKKISQKIFQIVILIALAGIIFINSGGTAYIANAEKIAKRGTDSFKVAIYNSETSDNSQILYEAIVKCMEDEASLENVSIEICDINYNKSVTPVFNNCNLIFTIGKSALEKAYEANPTVPIVSVGAPNLTEFASDKTTRVTGFSSMPNLELTLSMLIEVTPDLSSVALLYGTGDEDAIYQNKVLEQLLDEAGIPWKEYQIYPFKKTDEYPVTYNPGNIATLPKHTAEVSENWDKNKNRIKTSNGFGDPKFFMDVIKDACRECSAVYIPGGSDFLELIPYISAYCVEKLVPTIGGDEVVGANTYVSVYTDPFDQGYKAGKKAYNIMSNVFTIEDEKSKVEVVNMGNMVKLYTAPRMVQYGKQLPKSFRDIDLFFENYVTGSLTPRLL